MHAEGVHVAGEDGHGRSVAVWIGWLLLGYGRHEREQRQVHHRGDAVHGYGKVREVGVEPHVCAEAMLVSYFQQRNVCLCLFVLGFFFCFVFMVCFYGFVFMVCLYVLKYEYMSVCLLF
jgi:hypothetical protein